jgi:hypothetical protein
MSNQHIILLANILMNRTTMKYTKLIPPPIIVSFEAFSYFKKTDINATKTGTKGYKVNIDIKDTCHTAKS